MVRVKIGDKYNRLLVKEYLYSDNHYRKFWKCLCDCGNFHTTHSGSLRSGNTKSCGCLKQEQRKATRISLHHSDITAVIKGYQRHAKRRNYEWNLSREEVENIIQKDCYYCNLPPTNIKITKNTLKPFKYSGIDRLDNSKGYIKSNVVPCCSDCNKAKGTKSFEEFINWIKRLAEQWG